LLGFWGKFTITLTGNTFCWSRKPLWLSSQWQC